MECHSTAVVSPDAVFGIGNRLGPYVVIENDVVVGCHNRFEAHAVIKRGTRMGDDNVVHDHAVIGGTPQDLKFEGGRSFVQIGSNNIIREFVTIHRGARANSSTSLGSGCMLMAYSHVAHDCRVGDSVVIANNTALAGEVEVENQAFLSYGVGIHQFCRVGRLAMVGGISKIVQDVLPFFMVDGVPARIRGINRIGLERAGYGRQDILALKEAYHILLGSHLTLKQAILALKSIRSPCTDYLVEFITKSGRRGFHRKVRQPSEPGKT
jgi:UDP-N-acetylglucosamine acyltransferase